MRKGIAVAGNILVDKINEISAYPQSGELTQIKSVSISTGGAVPNVGIDLKRMDERLEVKAVGKIGNDDYGAFAIARLKENGLQTQDVVYGKDKTSFTEVMSVTGGQRTFFTYAGASAEFGVDDFNFDTLNVKMLHLARHFISTKQIGKTAYSIVAII